MTAHRLPSKPPVVICWLWPLYGGSVFIALLSAPLPRFQQLATLASAPSATGQLSIGEAIGLAELGLSLAGYARYFALLEVVAGLSFLLIGAASFWLRRDEWLPLFFAFGAAGFGLVNSPLVTGLEAAQPGWTPLLVVQRAVALLCFVLALLLFPNGRFVPTWTRVLGMIWTAYIGLSLFVPTLRLQSSLVWNSYGQVLVLVWALLWFLLIAGLQMVRYRRYATAQERAQTKWAVWGLALGMGASAVAAMPVLILPVLDARASLLMGTRMIAFTVVLLSSIGIAGAFAVAILHSGLWDIDAVINRTLVYGALTAILIVFYLTLIVLMQNLLRLITGQQTQFTIVVSTLVIAALFHPLRLRIQQLIDRGFYRSKYDRRRALDRFARTARSETNPEKLTEAVTTVVQEALQPASVNVWLRRTTPATGRPAERVK